jgi:hypothetical protein
MLPDRVTLLMCGRYAELAPKRKVLAASYVMLFLGPLLVAFQCCGLAVSLLLHFNVVVCYFNVVVCYSHCALYNSLILRSDIITS